MASSALRKVFCAAEFLAADNPRSGRRRRPRLESVHGKPESARVGRGVGRVLRVLLGDVSRSGLASERDHADQRRQGDGDRECGCASAVLGRSCAWGLSLKPFGVGQGIRARIRAAAGAQHRSQQQRRKGDGRRVREYFTGEGNIGRGAGGARVAAQDLDVVDRVARNRRRKESTSRSWRWSGRAGRCTGHTPRTSGAPPTPTGN